MRRISIIVTVALTALVLSTAAFAGNAHFIKNATTATENAAHQLVITFKETGLSSGATETIVGNATAVYSFKCLNNGGNEPVGWLNSSGSISGSTTVTADKNGNLVGSVTLTPRGCPPGQTTLIDGNVTYTNVTITDTTSGATLAITGTY